MIYLDHAATTPVNGHVLDKMYALEKEVFGNPSSTHAMGRKAKYYLEEARRYIATTISANEREIFFTSGGTEANNLAIIGTAFANQDKGNHIITTEQEHHAILHIMQYLQNRGFHVTYLPVNKRGEIDPYDVERALTDETILVSIMTANNETGVIQPIEAIGNLLKKHQAYFHTDAVQAYSLLTLDVKEIGIDLMSASGHKFNGPKGIGFLYKAEDVALRQMNYGGRQERNIRPGTENVIGAYGLYEAAKIAMEQKAANQAKYTKWKQLFITRLQESLPIEVNGTVEHALPHIVNISFPQTKLDVLLTNFDLAGIAASSGSACSAGTIEPSHVLVAMYGANNDKVMNSIRFSFGSANTEDDIIKAADKIIAVINRLI